MGDSRTSKKQQHDKKKICLILRNLLICFPSAVFFAFFALAAEEIWMTRGFFEYQWSIMLWFTRQLFFPPQESRKYVQQLLVQSQFSLGCALSCSLHFLHEGAAHGWLCLILAAALSWFLARQATLLLRHAMALFQLHSSQRYCGICIGLLTSGHCLLPLLCRILTITFLVAVVAAVSIINKHFLSATEALRFWTPLTICYTLLIVYMQGEELIGQQLKERSEGEMLIMHRFVDLWEMYGALSGLMSNINLTLQSPSVIISACTLNLSNSIL